MAKKYNESILYQKGLEKVVPKFKMPSKYFRPLPLNEKNETVIISNAVSKINSTEKEIYLRVGLTKINKVHYINKKTAEICLQNTLRCYIWEYLDRVELIAITSEDLLTLHKMTQG